MEMTPTDPLYPDILIFACALTGIISGLLGMVGGFIMSPVRYWLLQETGMNPDISIKAALGASLFVVIVQRKTLFLNFMKFLKIHLECAAL